MFIFITCFVSFGLKLQLINFNKPVGSKLKFLKIEAASEARHQTPYNCYNWAICFGLMT